MSSEMHVNERLLEIASKFYGLDIDYFSLEDSENNNHIVDVLKQDEVNAVIISSKVMPYTFIQENLLSLLNRSNKQIPILIMNINPHIDPKLLLNMSGGIIKACVESQNVTSKGFLRVGVEKAITRQLAGQRLPYTDNAFYHLVLDDMVKHKSIIEITNKNNDVHLPFFTKIILGKQELFFLTELKTSDSSKKSSWQFSRESFFQIVPLLMFLRYSCGERCWHTSGHYANLTIDDPWIREPYGSLSYTKLLEEMKKANFHLTIGFIPWNYDRSEPEAVSIFKDYPDKFSISIHGNNHDHYEFYKYKTNSKDPWPAKPLPVQEANIKQAIARMEKFKKLTGLSYDRVMVFPHNIAPSKTLGMLKKYNFLATCNSTNIPLESDEPSDPLFKLRVISLDFENFTSIKRYPVNSLSQVDIAINLFLDNPVLLYGHVYAYDDMFSGGIDAFNKTAEMVNNLQPDIIWQNLGHISKHLYLQRRREDGNYEIRALCKSIIINNTHDLEITYFYQKQESFSPPVEELTVDGQPYPYERSGNNLTFTLTIPAGESCCVDIKYESNMNITSIDISKNDLRVYILRQLSYFRDNLLASNILGRTFIYYYYKKGLFKFGLKGLSVLFFLMVLLVFFVYLYSHKHFKHN